MANVADVNDIVTPYVGVELIAEKSYKGCHNCYFEKSFGDNIEDCVGCDVYKCYTNNVIFKEVK
jgi:hypothetical protein